MLHARKRPIHLHYSHIVPRSKSHGVAARFARYLLRVYTNIRNDTQIVCMCVSLPSVSTARRFFFLLAMAYGRQRVDARTYDDVPSIGIGVCVVIRYVSLTRNISSGNICSLRERMPYQ